MQQWILYSQLQTAIQFNDLKAAECLLKQGLDSDYRFGNARMPALCMSSKTGHCDLVRLLIEHGCSINQADDCGQTALHFASSFIFVDIARLLIQHRANVDATNNFGLTPLHLSVMSSSIDLVRLLVESGASIEKRDCNGQTPLLLACKMNNLPIAQYLVAKGANVNSVDKDGNTPLLLSIDSGLSICTSLVKLLLNAGADPNKGNKIGSLPLLSTIRRSSDHIQDGVETVQALIEHQCDINCHDFLPPFFGESALNLAITRSQDSITEKLIRSGANVEERSINGQSPFVRLVKEGKTDLAKLALASSSTAGPTMLDWPELEREREKLAHSDAELFVYLFRERPFFPRLKQLSRAKLRHWLGSSADRLLGQLQLPYSIRKFLLLGEV